MEYSKYTLKELNSALKKVYSRCKDFKTKAAACAFLEALEATNMFRTNLIHKNLKRI